MECEDLKRTEEILKKIPVEYLPAYELEAYEIESPYYDLFMGYLKEYLKENIDACTEIDDIDIYVTADNTLSVSISYRYDCEEFPYEQTDVDEFKHCHLKFEDTYKVEIVMKDVNLADVVDTLSKHLGWHIEWEVEDKATGYSRYDPYDEYVKPEERWPNDR